MAGRKKADRVREPVQVYLDGPDLDLLERLGAQTGDTKAELLRRGLRALAVRVLTDKPPGWSFELLVGAMGDDPSIPTDLSERHDEYLYAPAARGKARGRSRPR
jgi:hypothetical protein